MANIIFRGGAVPTSANAAIGVAPTAKGLPLTNDEIDKNLFALNLGPTIGTTTISPGATSLTLAGLTSVTATSFIGTASNVTTNANLTGGVTSVGNAATVITNANLTGGVTSVGNAATVITNANLTGGVTSVGNATTVVTNANLTGGVTSVGNATTVVTNANLTGDVTSVGNATTLANTAVTAGSYGSTTAIPVITVDSKGRLTSASTSAITVGDGALTLGIGTAAATATTVTIGTGTGFTANSSTASTYDIKVGPALTNLATLMTTATAGFIRRTGQDTYAVDTNTYLTSFTEADTLASVTGRGFITRASSTAFATGGQGNPALEVYGAGGVEPSYLTFHRPGVFAIKLGLDGSDLKVGGWSMGAVAYKVWHEGNLTNLNQLTNSPGYTATRLSARNTNDTFVSGDISFIGGGVTTVTRDGNAFTVSSTDTNTVTRLRGTADGTYRSGDLTLLAGTNVSITQSGTDYTITSSYTDTNTTYNHLAVTATGGAFLRLNGSNSVNDDVKFASDGGTTVSYVNDETIKISSTSVGDGALTIAARTAGATNTDVTLELSTAYSANTSTATTIKAVVGPALTALTTFMTTATAGFIRRTGADTYGIDTNTYLTSFTEADTLATVTGRGATTGVACTFTNATDSTSSTTGALKVTGGVGIEKNLYVGGNTIGISNCLIQSGTTNSIQFKTGAATSAGASISLVSSSNGGLGSITFTAAGATFSGTVAGTNLSGTNTGDQTLPTTLPHNGTALSATTGTFSGAISCTTETSDAVKSDSYAAKNGTGLVKLTGIATLSTATPTNGLMYYVDSAGYGLHIASKSTDSVRINWNNGIPSATNRQLVVGNGDQTDVFHVKANGNVVAAGDITAFSDARIKTNITKIDNALGKVQQLNGYTYDRTDIETTRQTGVIAQEVIKVLPEAVLGSEDTTYSVAYGNMMGLMIEAIKELNAKVTDLQNQLAINK